MVDSTRNRWIASSAVVCIFLATFTILPSADATSAHRASCLPRRAHTVAQDRLVRVYALTTKNPANGTIESEMTYACLLRTGKVVKLIEHEGGRFPGSVDNITLSGPIVAFTYTTHGIDTGNTDIVVVNVASRHQLLKLPGVGGDVDAGIISIRDIEDLLVTRNGSVAWITGKGRGRHVDTFQVYDALVGGTPILLEEGPEIAPNSLSLFHRRLTWDNAGQPHSTYLLVAVKRPAFRNPLPGPQFAISLRKAYPLAVSTVPRTSQNDVPSKAWRLIVMTTDGSE
jgi:hypothetical protein